MNNISTNMEPFHDYYIRMCDDWRTMFDLLKAKNWMRNNRDQLFRVNVEKL